MVPYKCQPQQMAYSATLLAITFSPKPFIHTHGYLVSGVDPIARVVLCLFTIIIQIPLDCQASWAHWYSTT